MHGPHKFEPSGDFIERLEGEERREAIPPDAVVAGIGPLKGKTVLDLGAGIGYFTFPIARRAANVIAVDIEPAMLQELISRVDRLKAENVSILRAEITELPIADSSVDIVLAAFVYHEVDSQRKLMAECARVLKPSGVLSVVDFQKKKTSFGPPVSDRKTPEHVVRSAGHEFDLSSRSDDDVYYQVQLTRKKN